MDKYHSIDLRTFNQFINHIQTYDSKLYINNQKLKELSVNELKEIFNTFKNNSKLYIIDTINNDIWFKKYNSTIEIESRIGDIQLYKIIILDDLHELICYDLISNNPIEIHKILSNRILECEQEILNIKDILGHI